LKVLTAFTASD